MSLPDDDFEDAALDAALDAEPKETVAAPAPTDNDARAAIEGNEPAPTNDNQQPEAQRPTGDLSVALRQERERNKEIQARLKQAEEDRTRFMALLERSQPQPKQPDPEPEKVPNFWENPDAFLEHHLKQRLNPYEQQLAETREIYSRRAAVLEHGTDTVDAAYSALEEAIKAGQINGQQVVSQLRQNPDPFGEIVKWYQNRPEAQEQKLRSTLEAEILAKYGITPETPPAPSPSPAPAAPAPGVTSLPSLNQANGNAGNQQPASISEEDIFNATPAFGKRKA